MNTTERVIAVINKTQHLEPGVVTADSTFVELNIDSLDGINIVFALENEFDVQIPDEGVRELRDVRGVVEGIERLLAAKGEGPPAA
ncbi:MAG: acyl carrier protein [Acidobacteria bacterium]|nr:acyl carrier protein [Acidobacteriota bacterium]